MNRNFTIFYRLGLLSLAFTIAPVAYATVSISWNTLNLVNESVIDGGNPLATNSIWQLIWSPVDAIEPILYTDPLTPQGDEVLLLETRNTIPGLLLLGSTSLYDAITYGLPEDDFVDGYVFSRIFDYQGMGTPGVGTWYFEGVIPLDGPLTDQDPPSGPAGTPTAHDPTGGVFGSAVNLDQQIMVPEPHTIVLFALGSIVVWIRHRRR